MKFGKMYTYKGVLSVTLNRYIKHPKYKVEKCFHLFLITLLSIRCKIEKNLYDEQATTSKFNLS